MRRTPVFIVIILALAFMGCEQKPAAVINEVKVSQNELNWYLKEKLSEHAVRGVSPAETMLRQAVLQQIISERLLVEGAREKGLAATDAEIDAEVAFIKQKSGEDAYSAALRDSKLSDAQFRSILANRIMANKFVREMVKADEITEEMIADFYQKSDTPFLHPETVKIRFIQTRTRDEAEALLRELKDGKQNFDEFADLLAAEKRAVVSHYSWADPDLFRPEIADALKKIQEGEYDGPFEAALGTYIFRVQKRDLDRVKTLEEATPEIRALLVDRKRQAAMAHWLADKRNKSKIVITQ